MLILSKNQVYVSLSVSFIKSSGKVETGVAQFIHDVRYVL
jgi:hypothetical protein